MGNLRYTNLFLASDMSFATKQRLVLVCCGIESETGTSETVSWSWHACAIGMGFCPYEMA